VDWEVTIRKGDIVEAKAIDQAGNEEKMAQRIVLK